MKFFPLALASALLASADAACVLSNVFGDHMVLQRAPVSSMVWGFAASGTGVTTTFGGQQYKSTADATGTWRQALPPQAANPVGQSVNFTCSTGESFGIVDVLFGDVVICGGQSNMQFTLDCIGTRDGYNATAEAAEAANYPTIRTMTVGTYTTSYVPLAQLGAPPLLPWSVASPATIGGGNWSATSAVCWYYGKDLTDALNIPIGLVSSNWGGTIIQSWSDNATVAACGPAEDGTFNASTGNYKDQHDDPLNYVAPEDLARVSSGPNPNTGYGVLFNAMIYPWTVGPMPVSSFIWFQGESNCGENPSSLYSCHQTKMIQSWRSYFNSPNAFFGFVELEPWIGGPPPAFRTAQLASLSLPNVGYAIGTDIGDPLGPFGSVHPRNKKLVGSRLAAAALSIQYNKPTNWVPPSYASAVAGAAGTTVTVTVSFSSLPTTLVAADDHCKTELGVPAASCAWFSIVASDGATYNATATVAGGGKTLLLSANVAKAGTTAVGSTFGYNQWPINTIMTAEGLPLQPWPVMKL